MTIQRAYSQLTLKAFDDGRRTFKGIATTPSTDRMGDIVEPKGAIFNLPIPLLWQHDSRDPIGWVTAASISDQGIEIEGEVARVFADETDEGSKALSARLSMAWSMMKAKLVRGLSIGFQSVEAVPVGKTYSFRFKKWEWLELSAVTIPANADATITAIKQIDTELRAASGQAQGGSRMPGASGALTRSAFAGRHLNGTQTMTLKELLDARQTKAARLDEIAGILGNNPGDDADTLGAEFDGLETDIKSLDNQIRVAKATQIKAAGAAPVAGGNGAEGRGSRGPTVFARNADPEDSFKGQSYTRLLMAKAAAFAQNKEHGTFVSPADIARHRWGKTHPQLVNWIKTAVAGGGTGSGEWGAELAQSDARFQGDFINYLWSMTIFDRLPLRSIPARVKVKGQDGVNTGYWVGESKGIPVSKADFSDVELLPLKVAALTVCSKELILDSSPSAEMLLRDSIAEASAQRVDTTFLSAAAAVSGVSPAGIFNGLTPLAPSGTDAAAVRADYQALVQPFIQAKNAGGLVHVMTPSTALAISLLVNALGQTEFAGITTTGGTLFNNPVFTGDNVEAGTWAVLKPSDIWKIGDTGIDISMSDSAMIEQNDAPQGAGDTPTAASATLMSLWQTEQVGFKVVRRINYAKRRAGAVQLLSNAEYGGVIS